MWERDSSKPGFSDKDDGWNELCFAAPKTYRGKNLFLLFAVVLGEAKRLMNINLITLDENFHSFYDTWFICFVAGEERERVLSSAPEAVAEDHSHCLTCFVVCRS